MFHALALISAICAAVAAPAGASPVSVGTSGWMWGDPAPQGETLNRVAFSGARGYAAGAGGTVLRSDDGGSTWAGLISGTTSDLTLLQEVDQNTVIVGGGCTVRESTDAGASFHRLAVNESESGCATKVGSFAFLNAATGYVEQADGSMLLTRDAGQTLEPRTAVPLAGAAAGPIAFTSETAGLALADRGGQGVIYRTKDGSGSWEQVATSPEPLHDIAYVTPSLVYVVGDGGVLLASEDAGATWTKLPLALPAGSVVPNLTGISCSDARHCLIATAPAPGGASNALVRTVDGGQTASLVTASGQNLLSVSFSTAARAVAVGSGGATVISADGGETFPTAVSSRLGATLTGPIRIGGSGAQDAYIAGNAGVIAATTDGGSSWGLLRVPTSADIVDTAFPTPAIGYAVSSTGTAYRTSSGGLTWAILNSGGGEPSELLAPNQSTVLLLGPTGLRRSTDGGASFAAVGGSISLGRRHGKVVRRSVASFPLFAGAQVAGQALVAWGDEAIESTDGGASWHLIPRPLAAGSIDALSFVSASTGYVASRGRLFFTRNAGRTWQEIGSLGVGVGDGSDVVSFSNVADGYVLGAGGELLRTSDAGRTWTPEDLPQTPTSVAAGGSFDYAASESGLFETADGGLSPNASSLTLRLEGSHRIALAKLSRRQGRVQLSGTLSPAVGGEKVTIAYRTPRRGWHSRVVTVAADGAFSLQVSGLHASTEFVAHWSGEGAVAGAGTPALSLTVTKKR